MPLWLSHDSTPPLWDPTWSLRHTGRDRPKWGVCLSFGHGIPSLGRIEGRLVRLAVSTLEVCLVVKKRTAKTDWTKSEISSREGGGESAWIASLSDLQCVDQIGAFCQPLCKLPLVYLTSV